MRILTSTNGRWPKKVTSLGSIPLLLTQVLISLVCVPATLKAGTEFRREMTWEELPAFLEGETRVTIVLSEEGAVRGDAVSVQENGIHLQRITMATDRKRYPEEADALIRRGAVQEIHFETMQGNMRTVGAVVGGVGGFFLVPGMVAGLTGAREGGSVAIAVLVGMIGGSVGLGSLGYRLGKNADRETTIITIVD